MVGTLLLVRHPPVTLAWQKRCYGQSDPGLSRAGKAMVGPLVNELVSLKPDLILHSDMVRTRAIALPLARCLGIAAQAEPLWRERHFGDWEGQSWQRIYHETGNAMDGMIDDPDGFRPGGNGETTSEMTLRITKALAAIPNAGCIAIISHGGPLAAARHYASSNANDLLQNLIPAPGSITRLSMDSPKACNIGGLVRHSLRAIIAFL